jgi:hypothetical protein
MQSHLNGNKSSTLFPDRCEGCAGFFKKNIENQAIVYCLNQDASRLFLKKGLLFVIISKTLS